MLGVLWVRDMQLRATDKPRGTQAHAVTYANACAHVSALRSEFIKCLLCLSMNKLCAHLSVVCVVVVQVIGYHVSNALKLFVACNAYACQMKFSNLDCVEGFNLILRANKEVKCNYICQL